MQAEKVYLILVTKGESGGSAPGHRSPRGEVGLEICEMDLCECLGWGLRTLGGTCWAGTGKEGRRKPGRRRRQRSIKGPSRTARSPLLATREGGSQSKIEREGNARAATAVIRACYRTQFALASEARTPRPLLDPGALPLAQGPQQGMSGAREPEAAARS